MPYYIDLLLLGVSCSTFPALLSVWVSFLCIESVSHIPAPWLRHSPLIQSRTRSLAEKVTLGMPQDTFLNTLTPGHHHNYSAARGGSETLHLPTGTESHHNHPGKKRKSSSLFFYTFFPRYTSNPTLPQNAPAGEYERPPPYYYPGPPPSGSK